MTHSNNAARIRLWIRLKGGLKDHIRTVMVSHDDLYTEEFKSINPLSKVPALVVHYNHNHNHNHHDNNNNNNSNSNSTANTNTNTNTNGEDDEPLLSLTLFESFVILEYLEDRFGATTTPSLILDTPEDRAFVQLLVRCHDLYIASPNCTQPNFSHTQGCMYLDPVPTNCTPKHRTMDVATRAAKLAEIYKQLTWLEHQIGTRIRTRTNVDRSLYCYLAGGDRITHADCTWFPTCVFMELLLPLVFDWSPIFHETDHFPNLTQWFQKCLQNEHFALTHQEISGTLHQQHRQKRRFVKVREEAQRHPEYKWKYM